MAMNSKTIPIAVDGSRTEALIQLEPKNKIYVRAASGRFAAWRWAMVWLTQLVFYGLPWVTWHGRQAVLFDLAQQRFFLFGLVLYPQDLIYLTLLLVLAALTLFFVTAVAGRIWCGFSCPQTVYTKLFVWVERLTEGKPHASKALDSRGWGAEKMLRKGSKQALWLGISLWTGFTFVGYFTPIQSLASALPDLSMGPWDTFWVLFYGLFTYLNAGYLREQVCKHMCPYARFQSAMFDRDTLIIGYDSARGDARGPRSRSVDHKAIGLGDCTDCSLCVQVCPTGIDIRDGLQSNCIGCAACIDMCDGVMDQMKYPRGLIRYSSLNGLTHDWSTSILRKRVLRWRVLAYGLLLCLLTAALVIGLNLRSPFRLDVIRDRGVMARTLHNGSIENVYRLHLMNATEQTQRYRVEAVGLDGLSMTRPVQMSLAPIEAQTIAVSVQLPARQAESLLGKTLPMQFKVSQMGDDDGLAQLLENSTFHVPR
ncbi:MAG: cytochrome c oxidase accessory protein CcoG [Rhodoferax sp.]|nr:cytochrome c oxidase accessory protein CcoG [Rhodoferax sp.]MDD2883182.1 cytochrome c oxidase accessory protein CcoG [Rhodoferax sp.]